MNMDKFNEVLLESVGVGLAIIDAGSLEIMFGNRRFGEWFPGESGVGRDLADVFPTIDQGRLQSRLDSDRPFTTEAEIKVGRRSVSLAISVSRHRHNDMSVLILEAQNISKMKELEYMIESYSKMIEKQNRTLEREKERVEKLLLNVMPKSVYEELKTFGVTTPQKYEQASILMLDFVGFTDMAISKDPAGIITELNDIFTAFDRIAEQFGCERIKTMGDAYMAVSGIPEATPDHAHNIAKVALLMVRYLERRNRSHVQKWNCRIGINSGVVIGSIVGVQKYVYDIFGPGVNLAARLETIADEMEIALCEDMYDLIKDDFQFEDLGDHEVKGFGTKQIFSLTGTHEAVNFRL
ncbi:MAG: adenylate/guanylate cyclase domain-containing protein [Pseudomonadota bacterium]